MSWVTLEQYQKAKQERLLSAWQPRAACARCKKPQATCYCPLIQPFHSSPQFVILIHRDEVRRTVATGRMSHLCLKNSLFFEGTDFSDHEGVNAILANPKFFPVVLYPTRTAVNLSLVPAPERARLFPADKQLVVFVIDGTWSQAKRVRRLSRNLNNLPSVCFTPPRLSAFLVRRQPDTHCFSTIESIHHMIELLGGEPGGQHENLLQVFSWMVEKQVAYGHLRSFRHKHIKK